MLGIGIAFDPGLSNAGTFGRAVAAFGGLRCGTVYLHELGIVNVATKGALHGL
jgi:hypothetical protein